MYKSTRNNYRNVNASEAIVSGMVPGGGLFVPEELLQIDIATLIGRTYKEIANIIFRLYLNDFTQDEIKKMVDDAYGANFATEEVTPIKKVGEVYLIEQFHGPTAAFKDVALQMLPHLMVESNKKIGIKEDIAILVATSGDTGKAALEGFKNVEHIKVICLYPHQGVSRMQELQMRTTDGDNTFVLAVKGNFDDCQNKVKELFIDEEFKEDVKKHNYVFSSANSINWGRLLPQIVYYFYSYTKLIEKGQIQNGDPINVCVPTGNFGNVLAAYYASKMGLPINKFICASNVNNVLTDFFETGEYNRKRAFYKTNTPSMDILVSSNLERYLYEKSGRNGEQVCEWMQQLALDGTFVVDERTKAEMDCEFYAGSATDEEVLQMIKAVHDKEGYVLDPHTAVGYKVYEDYAGESKDRTPTLIAATASPFKFSNTVLRSLFNEEVPEEEAILQLEELMKEKHIGLQGLSDKDIKHSTICTIEEISDQVRQILN